ncbi:MAG: acetyl/propionyl/methylcrotonyl-CoA carboxylase subunit alpha [Betaproteobacteria bacterium]|jgi:geranyl-CoA carboxylase alpha subunit|nr:biotin/lipoyl-binding protein [Rhodocyclaceae bacterium]MCA3135119.1 biotin/lipoyl-binding protein [Rhodocyclaceae bacterium]MCA3143509.1 biotin/lipoyl-binding protein [Rhodocyclaceae bacterium]MCA3145399.1 biotin/lipoyl-binding protein [Rhodocyclaceae bacterium]
MSAIQRLLIANRGEIACRIARTARRMGISTVAVFSDADAGGPHVHACDTAVAIGGNAPGESYLAVDKIIAAARRSGADAIHPGYGFLSEKPAFARAVLEAGLVFVGPSPDAMEAMGDKALARRRMAAAGVPVLPGYDDPAQQEERLMEAARRIGFPVMIKAAAGGGGRGMRLVHAEANLPAALRAARAEAASAFGDDRLILERALPAPRHVEVQVFGDRHGHLLHLGERDCSIQRRHQKILEETPAPGLPAALRARLGEVAVRAAATVAYTGAGTVEFLLQDEEFFFMEMNTRLQVEHPVTEAVTGLDLVEWQVRVARGEALPWRQEDLVPDGHAIEVRLCAEDPAADFMPQSGRVERWCPPDGVRTDHAVAGGMTLSPFYDSMLAKIVAHGPTREAAREKLRAALADTVLFGVTTNRAFLARLLDHPAFTAEELSTGFLSSHFAEALDRSPAPGPRDLALAAWLSVRPVDAPATWLGFSSAAAIPVPVRITHGEMDLEGTAVLGRDGSATVQLGSESHRFDAQEPCQWHRRGGRIHLQTRTGEWVFHDQRLAARATAQTTARDGRVLAPMNGRVAHVAVAPGAAVRKGDVLVTLDAMKMEHALTARVSGTVLSVGVVENEQVAPGRLLVEIAPAG